MLIIALQTGEIVTPPVRKRLPRKRGTYLIPSFRFVAGCKWLRVAISSASRPTRCFCCIGRTMIGSIRPTHQRGTRPCKLIIPTWPYQTARAHRSSGSYRWMKVAGTVRRTTFQVRTAAQRRHRVRLLRESPGRRSFLDGRRDNVQFVRKVITEMLFNEQRVEEEFVDQREVWSAIRYLDPDEKDKHERACIDSTAAVLALLIIVCAFGVLLWLRLFAAAQ
jgi:hypothetical protein